MKMNTPVYPASTFPLQREKISDTSIESVPIIKTGQFSPYVVNGLFGFGALKNKIIRKNSIYIYIFP